MSRKSENAADEPTGEVKTRRKLSTSLQAMATIERAMSELDAKDRSIVGAWYTATYHSPLVPLSSAPLTDSRD